jgi:hypothetical protein
MADIKQAAKWMQEGKLVRRSVYRPEWRHGFDEPHVSPFFAQYLHSDDKGRIFSENDNPICLLIDALLAEDWEVVQAMREQV